MIRLSPMATPFPVPRWAEGKTYQSIRFGMERGEIEVLTTSTLGAQRALTSGV